MPSYRDLRPEELAALKAFAQQHGRSWKKVLAETYWPNARIWRDQYALHNLRNDLGPEWLKDFTL